MKTKHGISLIVLVLTVVVLGILASAVVIRMTDTDILGKTETTVLKNDLDSFKEAYDTYITSQIASNRWFNKKTINVTYGTDTFKKIFGDSVPEKYSNLQIVDGVLSYDAKTEEEKEICAELGISTQVPAQESWFTNCTLPTQAEMEAMGITSEYVIYGNDEIKAFDLAGKACFDTTTGMLYSVALPDGVTELVIPNKIFGVQVKSISGAYDNTHTTSSKAYSLMPSSISKVTVPENITLYAGAFNATNNIDFKVKNNGKVNADSLGLYAYIVKTNSPVRLGEVNFQYIYDFGGFTNVTNLSEITGYYSAGFGAILFANSSGSNIYEFPKGLSNQSLFDLFGYDYNTITSGTLKVTQSQFDYVKSLLTYTQVDNAGKKLKVTSARGEDLTDFYIEIW